MSGILYFVVHY